MYISKYVRVWALVVNEVLIASEHIFNKKQRGVQLLIEYLMSPLKMPLKISLKKPKLRDQH